MIDIKDAIIADFALTSEITRLYYGAEEKFMHKLVSTVYDDVSTMLHSAKFYNDTLIDDVVSDEAIKVTYKDDINGFDAVCTRDQISLYRPSSSFSDFRRWFNDLMPYWPEQVDDIIEKMAKLGGRKPTLKRVQFMFKFICYDFVTADGRPAANYQVLKKLADVLPDDNGILTTGVVPDSLARFDYSVHRWLRSPDSQYRNVVYQVAAPYNRNSSSLFFTFLYRNDTYVDSVTNARMVFPAKNLLGQYMEALEWCESKCFAGFMSSILDGYKFKMSSAERLWST